MALTLLRAPTADPLDLAEARLQCRVDTTDADLTLRGLIAAARDYAQALTGKQLIVARWKQVMDGFPCGFGGPIKLERHPVLRVESVQYLDLQGQVQTVDDTLYTVDYDSEPVRIAPVFGAVWPIPRPQIASVWVIFTAGYAAPVTFANSQVTVDGWPALAVGDVVRLSNSGGALPEPLLPNTDYYVQSIVSGGTYTLAASSGGQAINFTGSASGTCFLGEVPKGITEWMKLRLAAMYASPEEAAALSGTMVSLPFADRLLDGFKVIEF